MSDRAAYTAGLRALADLLDANPELKLPFEVEVHHMTVFIPAGADQIGQALSYIEAMSGPVTAEIEPGGGGPRVKVIGRIAGLSLKLHLHSNPAGERKITGIYTASDGSVHEVIEYAIPAEILAAVAERGAL